MKGFLILLAVAAPFVLLDPMFWSLWRMETSVERVGYVNQKGVTQWASLGPKARWPHWAIKPEGAVLNVRGHFEPAPGHVESGHGYITVPRSAGAAQAGYARQLEQKGWTVNTAYFDTTTPEVPPRRERLCSVTATRDGKGISLTLFSSKTPVEGQLHWRMAPFLPLIGSTPGRC